MKFSCDECSAQYMIADEKVGSRGVKVKCKKCGHIIVVKPAADGASDEAAAPAAADERPDVSADGGAFNAMFGTPGSDSAFNEPTQSMTSEQLDDLKAQAGGAPADPFSAPADDAFGAPDFGAPDFGAGAPDLGAVASEATASAGDADPFAAAAANEPVPGVETTDPGFDAAFGAAQRQESAPRAPSGRPPGEKEWYVAIDDSQVGPIDMAEIEQRWDALEIDEDTLAWKAGMADWVPVAEITDLAYLVTERPQERRQPVAAASAGLTSSAGVAAAAGGSLGPVAFGGDPAAPAGDVSWTPSAASALSSLVQDELTTPEKPEPSPAGPSPAELGMPQFGAGELFSGGDKGGNGGAAPAADLGPSMGLPLATDPFAGGVQPWSAPRPSEGKGGIRPIHIALGGMGLVVVALLAVVLVVVLRPLQQPAVEPGATKPGTELPGVAPGTQPSASAALGTQQPGATSEAPPQRESRPSQPAAETRRDKPREKKKDKPKEKPREKKKDTPKDKDLDEIFDAPRKAKGPPPKAKLSQADVMNGVKKNVGSLKPCLAAAQKRGELAPGKHKLVLDWRIKPDGSVTGANLKAPSYVLGTSLPGCFKRQMRGWTFPASQSGAPITNFPLPFTAK